MTINTVRIKSIRSLRKAKPVQKSGSVLINVDALFFLTLAPFARQFDMKFRDSDGELPEISSLPSGTAVTAPIIDQIALTKAIQNLAKGYRQIFLMHDLLGYGHEEIAQLQGISIGTSKSQLHKARMKLRTMLLE